jgi:hypothetical protein
MIDWIEIDQPYFTAAEVAGVAGIARGLADVWIHRGIISPSRVDRSAGRRRPLFSVRAIVKAKLVRILGEHFAIGPSEAADLAKDSDSTEIAEMLSGEDWMFAVRRSLISGKQIDLSVAVARIGKKWRWQLFVTNDGIVAPFGPDVPYIVLPLATIFIGVITECTALFSGRTPDQPKKARRARS